MSPGQATVLLVDDDAEVRMSLRALFRRWGFRVQEAANGREALARVIQLPDLVVLDIGLPDIDGLEVCRIMRTDPRLSSIPVLQISGTFIDHEHKIQSLEHGADAYLAHPIEPTELLATAKALLRMKRAEQSLLQAEKRAQALAARQSGRTAGGSERDLVDIQEELDAARRLLATLLEVTHDAVIVTDEQMRVVDVNPAAAALAGRPREALLGLPIVQHLVRLDRGQIAIIEEVGHLEARTPFVAADGEELTVSVTAAATRGDDGTIVWVIRANDRMVDTTEGRQGVAP